VQRKIRLLLEGRPPWRPTFRGAAASHQKHKNQREKGQEKGQSRVLTLFKKSESFQGWQGHYESNMRGRFIM
jgi:hypothetical protein